jgi:flagellar basal-body rod protein FlgB
MSGKIDDYLRFHESALSLRSQRQQMLASNIANADTPHYKARDIDFGKTLQAAMQRPAGAAGMATTSPLHLGGLHGSSGAAPKAQFRGVIQGSVDGNTVDMDTERNQFTDNAVRYEAGITIINSQIKSMLSAIQGQ